MKLVKEKVTRTWYLESDDLGFFDTCHTYEKKYDNGLLVYEVNMDSGMPQESENTVITRRIQYDKDSRIIQEDICKTNFYSRPEEDVYQIKYEYG